MPTIGFSLGTPMGRLTSEDMGVPSYFDAIMKGVKAGYLPQQLQAEQEQRTLANQIKIPYAANAGRAFEADIGGQEANIGLTNQNILKQKILNSFLGQREPAEIEEIRQRGNYYGMGGGAGGVGAKYLGAYNSGVAKDNPHLTSDKLQEAANVLAQGGNQLADGTPLNPMSFGTKIAFDNAVKSTTTAGQINQSNLANQAEAEIDVFTNLSNQWRAPYADTVGGMSPQQVIDTFKSDDKSQTQLGELIASNALEFEIAQIRNRIAGGQPGITSTQQLMDESMQHIKAAWPKLSAKARQTASARINEALKAGLHARNTVGVGAGGAYTRQFPSEITPPKNAYTEKMLNSGQVGLVPLGDEQKDPLGLGL